MSTVEVHGPFFDGAWEPAVDDLVFNLSADLGDDALGFWREDLNDSIRVNQGRYMSHTNLRRVSRSETETNDERSLYGPWLEGTGSRNSPVTRFRGYGAAARATAETDAIAVEAAQPRVDVFVKEMNA